VGQTHQMTSVASWEFLYIYTFYLFCWVLQISCCFSQYLINKYFCPWIYWKAIWMWSLATSSG